MSAPAIYVDALELARLAKDSRASAVYSFRRALRCVVIARQRYKLRFCSDAQIEVLRESYYCMARALGRKKIKDGWSPSSWASLFAEVARVPRLSYTKRRALPERVIGGWNETRIVGRIKEPLYHYDLVSAYYWAALQPLPVARRSRLVFRYEGPGLYLFNVTDWNVPTVPRNIRRKGEHWVTHEEISALKLQGTVTRGFVFAEWWKPSAYLALVREHCQSWKQVLKAYWGGWATERGPEVHYPMSDKRRTLGNPWSDVVSASFITARVRVRLAVDAPDALYYYTDTVLVPRTMKAGSNIGDWRLEGKLIDADIRGAGRYVGISEKGERIEKHAGRKLLWTRNGTTRLVIKEAP